MQSEDINSVVVVCVFAFDITGEIIEFQIDFASEYKFPTPRPSSNEWTPYTTTTIAPLPYHIQRQLYRSTSSSSLVEQQISVFVCKFYVVRKLNFIGLMPSSSDDKATTSRFLSPTNNRTNETIVDLMRVGGASGSERLANPSLWIFDGAGKRTRNYYQRSEFIASNDCCLRKSVAAAHRKWRPAVLFLP